ncbi:MAG: dTDP-4-dehydrorhamnose reductase [Rubrobacteraceae bacterium]
MRVLVTGAGGQLGRELVDVLPEESYEVVALSRKELDVSEPPSVGDAVEHYSPEVVVNAAAYTNVDGCETEVEAAYAVNSLGPRNLARFCEPQGCELLHVSTNYVFDGYSPQPYEPFDLPNPISVYGRTKLAGEDYVRHLSTRWYVIRTAGVYGRGHNFVRTMLRLAGEHAELKIKADEFFSPTYARDLAQGIASLLSTKDYGVYHLTNTGSCSWYEFTRKIFEIAGIETRVTPIPSSEFPLPAARPANGVLSTLGSPGLRHWQEALADYLAKELRT